MMERELADLLIRMGLASGVEMERAADELATVAFPSFVNARAFRSAVLESVEAHMRAQMEQRLNMMRQKFDAGTPLAAAVVTQPPPQPPDHSPSPVVSQQPAPVARDNVSEEIGSLDTIIADMEDHDEGGSDDTIVWSPRRG